MKYCEACQISFSVDSNDCPFCENKLVIRTMSNELQNYPHYKKTETEKYYWKKAFNYSVISLLIVSTYLNMFGWSQHPYFWSLIFNAGVIYLWKIVKVTIFEKNYKRKAAWPCGNRTPCLPLAAVHRWESGSRPPAYTRWPEWSAHAPSPNRSLHRTGSSTRGCSG